MMNDPEIILGPPGTGKTTTLLDAVEAELAAGVPPDRIGYVSFTRRAANEAITRACDKFGLAASQFPYFRTLQSLCYRWLGLQKTDVLDDKRLQEFAAYAGVQMNGKWSDDGTLSGFLPGDRILFMEQLARLRMVSLEEQYNVHDGDGLTLREVKRVAACLQEFKREHDVIDYTDMLLNFQTAGRGPLLDVLFVDEAQDLSLLQWSVVRVLAKNSRRLVIAGDDDQAIYRWAGADVDTLIDMRGQVRVLGQSWRVPPAIQRVADKVISSIRHRRPKQWAARPGSEGEVQSHWSIEDVDCGEGDTLILARNIFVVYKQIIPMLRHQGIIYELNGNPSIKTATLEAVTDWERLRAGEVLTVDEARRVYKHMKSGTAIKRGFKELTQFDDTEPVMLDDLVNRGGLLTQAIWHEALGAIPVDDMSYMLRARQRGEKLRAKPRVRVSTIHGSKGGEADHVVVMKEMAYKTFQEMRSRSGGMDDEARVWYVAATRARQRLSIVKSRTNLTCPWL